MGDILPFLSLGARLRRRGHRVVVAVSPSMVPIASRAGLEVVPSGVAFNEEVARRYASAWDVWRESDTDPYPPEKAAAEIAKEFEDISVAVAGADLLVASALQEAAAMVHKRIGIPWVSVASSPGLLHGPANPDLYPTELSELDLPYFEHFNLMRRHLGFPAYSEAEWGAPVWSKDLMLLASSPHFSAPPISAFPQLEQTGFWFDEGGGSDWVPERRLQAFMDAGSPPLVLTFSSLPVLDAQRVVSVHVEAARLIGKRIIIQRGWANFGPELLADHTRAEHIYWAGHIPHQWLFARAAAVCHHGGILTTAEAVRCGCPMVVEPYGNDQPFNAMRVVQLGIGAAMHPHKVTAEGLATILSDKVLVPSCAQRLSRLSSLLRDEDGLSRACEAIETML